MKRISSYLWNIYKQSEDGKELIRLFEFAMNPHGSFGANETLDLCKKIDSPAFLNTGEENDCYFLDNWYVFRRQVNTFLAESPNVEELDTEAVYDAIIEKKVQEDIQIMTEKPSKKKFNPENMAYKFELGFSMQFSMALYAYMPFLFLPNLFVMQFGLLQKFAAKYEIVLPPVPVRSNYKARCHYYVEMCKALWEFAHFNSISNPAELCAFVYGLELSIIREEIEQAKSNAIPTEAARAWFIGGNYCEAEKDMEYGFWQADEMTSRGDIMIFIEKKPVKAINSIWIAMEDGVADPFFSYYSYSFIGRKISVPLITTKEIESHPHLKNHPLVRQNFQGLKGRSLTSDDYYQLLQLLKEKGCDTETLPKLFQPEGVNVDNLSDEAEVSKRLICELLEQMGWRKDKDYSAEVHFAAGHGETGMKKDKRPDFCLHQYQVNGNPRAKVIIESKFELNDKDQRNAAFSQTETYAGWGHATVMLICDRRQIRVYERRSNYEFDPEHCKIFRWFDMSNNDKFQELKNILK